MVHTQKSLGNTGLEDIIDQGDRFVSGHKRLERVKSICDTFKVLGPP